MAMLFFSSFSLMGSSQKGRTSTESTDEPDSRKKEEMVKSIQLGKPGRAGLRFGKIAQAKSDKDGVE